MTGEELEEIRAEHRRVRFHGADHCIGCTRRYGGYHEWPCETAGLLAEVDRLRELAAERAEEIMRLGDEVAEP